MYPNVGYTGRQSATRRQTLKSLHEPLMGLWLNPVHLVIQRQSATHPAKRRCKARTTDKLQISTSVPRSSLNFGFSPGETLISLHNAPVMSSATTSANRQFASAIAVHRCFVVQKWCFSGGGAGGYGVPQDHPFTPAVHRCFTDPHPSFTDSSPVSPESLLLLI
ncbi:hypothetical protein HAX54_048960 [Datura stramonium]|uniref:Uncharacterized protein n=1 Tax=Datura stramonium TaxID=4076 RepID=A0ABS8RR15_DATST|nr:hypothetical protein [Datura stramonium]